MLVKAVVATTNVGVFGISAAVMVCVASRLKPHQKTSPCHTFTHDEAANIVIRATGAVALTHHTVCTASPIIVTSNKGLLLRENFIDIPYLILDQHFCIIFSMLFDCHLCYHIKYHDKERKLLR